MIVIRISPHPSATPATRQERESTKGDEALQQLSASGRGKGGRGGFRCAVDRSIGYGYVRSEAGIDRQLLRSGAYEPDVASRRVPASIHFAPLYDPDNERIRS